MTVQENQSSISVSSSIQLPHLPPSYSPAMNQMPKGKLTVMVIPPAAAVWGIVDDEAFEDELDIAGWENVILRRVEVGD